MISFKPAKRARHYTQVNNSKEESMGEWKEFITKALEIIGIYVILRAIYSLAYRGIEGLVYKDAYTKGAKAMEVEDTRQLTEAAKVVMSEYPESSKYIDILWEVIKNNGKLPEKKKDEQSLSDMVIKGFSK